MGYVAKNSAYSTLAGGITDVAVSVTVQAGKGALFAVTAPEHTYATFEDVAGNIEVVKVTARATDTLTIVRAQDGTAARAWSSGDIIECRPCAAAMNDYAVGPQIDGATAKTTPVDADTMGLIDSAASNALKKVTWANIKATLASTFAALAGSVSQAFAAASIELGHATDTTISRVSAGVMAVEGKPVMLSAPRVGSVADSATPTINTDNVDIFKVTALTTAITSFTTNLSGTPSDGQVLIIQITGTAARAITWGASFEASTVALPTTTVTTAMLSVGFLWNSVTSKWRCMAAV